MATAEFGSAVRRWRDRAPPEAECAADAGPAECDTGGGLRRGLDVTPGQSAVRGTDGGAGRVEVGDNQRNAVWRTLLGPGSRVRHTPESWHAFAAALVADLRAAAGRYPADAGLHRLVAELRVNSARFAALWDSGAVGTHEAARKTIDHPHAGALPLDCDVLIAAGSDVRIMVHTAEPGTEDAARLDRLTALDARTG